MLLISILSSNSDLGQLKSQLNFLSQEFNSLQESVSEDVKSRKIEISNSIINIQDEIEPTVHSIPVVFNIAGNASEDYEKQIRALVDQVNSLVNNVNHNRFDQKLDSITNFSKLAASLDLSLCLEKLISGNEKSIEYLTSEKVTYSINDLNFLSEEKGGLPVKMSEKIINTIITLHRFLFFLYFSSVDSRRVNLANGFPMNRNNCGFLHICENRFPKKLCKIQDCFLFR